MTRFELAMDLNLLLSCELVRYTQKDKDITILVVADSSGNGDTLDEDSFSAIQGEDDCCSINGRLLAVTFHEVSDVSIQGEECDNYRTLSVLREGNHISMKFEGHNFYEPDSELSLAFSFVSYDVKDEGRISTPNV